MKETSTLTELQCEEASQRLQLLADVLSGAIELNDANDITNLKLLSQEVIQYLKSLL